MNTQVSETKGFWNKICSIPGRLDHKLIIVTGANTGIGFYTTSELARRGAKVIMACRNLEKAKSAKQSILAKYGSLNPNHMTEDVQCDEIKSSLSAVREDQLVIEHLDLASFSSIRQFVDHIISTYSSLHYLINNAGLSLTNYEQTRDGLEMVMGVNHLGPFLLTELLLPLLKQSVPSRVIILSSMMHYYAPSFKPNLLLTPTEYGFYTSYCQSKLANAIYAKELGERLEGSGVQVASVHPGMVRTELLRNMNSWISKLGRFLTDPLFINPWQGAQTTLYTVLTSNLVTGGYYSNCAIKQPASVVRNKEIQAWLRELSSELVGLKTV